VLVENDRQQPPRCSPQTAWAHGLTSSVAACTCSMFTVFALAIAAALKL
jgi:hypothetical protein